MGQLSTLPQQAWVNPREEFTGRICITSKRSVMISVYWCGSCPPGCGLRFTFP